jgi:hypothetical protein
MDIHTRHKLSHAVTEYDRKQSTRKGYNMYALSLYLGAVQNAETEADAGIDLRKALVHNFTGRLLDVVLTAVGLPKSTDQEQRF